MISLPEWEDCETRNAEPFEALSDLQEQRQKAWVGDAVLSLYARTWILRERQCMDGELCALFTSNEFLATIGNPTAVEAAIGALYEAEGLESAFAWIEREIRPRFETRRRKQARR